MNQRTQEKKNKQAEMSAAVAAHQYKVRELLTDAVKAGFMTERELQLCIENADGSRWDAVDHSSRKRPTAVNVDVVWQTYDYNAFSAPSYLYPSANVKDTCSMIEKLYNRKCRPVKLKY